VAQTDGTVARSLELGLRPLRCAKAHRRGRIMESGAGERRRGGFLIGVGRRGEGGESDRWGSVDRETRERRPASKIQMLRLIPMHGSQRSGTT
jgi:hypothetical protein